MKKKQLRFTEGFRVAIGNARSQAAEMVIPPGDGEGDPKPRTATVARTNGFTFFRGAASQW